MANKNGRKGSLFETTVLKWLRSNSLIAERLTKAGAKDEGDIKNVGKDLFMKEYRQAKSTPDNFKIQDEAGFTCMFIVMDKYTSVDETKAGILSQFEGLLSENVVYKFNADLVEKYGAVLSELILNCPDIEEEDKSNLISGEKTFAVTKGSIDRLMQYDSPEAVFELINPIVALKK